MEKLTTAQLLATFKKMKYVLDETPYYPNLYGVRTETQVPNLFDDYVGAIWKDKSGNWLSGCYEATTDPGVFYLQNPMNVDGTIIMVPGQYLKVYKLGLHTGYIAFEQIKPIKYVRDNNKNKILDFLYRTTGYKFFMQLAKTNIHHANAKATSTYVEKWSAGCQVVRRILEYGCLIELATNWVKILKGVNEFNYALFEEKDVVK